MERSPDSRRLDLDAYLRRVDYQGDRTATVESLHALQRAHMLHIPFENLEIIAGRPIELDVPSLERKLVREPRGGYCFEHVRLFGTALEALGFGVEGFIGRVRLNQEPGARLSETHAVLRVTSPDTGERWLSDVGFGDAALAPARFEDGAEVAVAGRRFRLVREDEWVWTWQRVLGEGTGRRFQDLHAFALTPRQPIDYEVANHYVSTWPTSPFVTRPIVARVTEDGSLHRLDGAHYGVEPPDGGSGETRVLDPGELPKALEGVFGIRLDTADSSAVVQRLRAWTERS